MQHILFHRQTFWMTPKLAVAENFDQFVALDNHSRLSRRKKSLVVPALMKPWQIMIEEYTTELRDSIAA